MTNTAREILTDVHDMVVVHLAFLIVGGAPETTHVTMSSPACRCVSNPRPSPSRCSSWQTIGPNAMCAGS